MPAPRRRRRRRRPTSILVNGKIVTVDDRFTIAEALAIRGQRIVAVGTNAEIEKLKGPQTRTIALERPHRHPRPDRQPFALGARRRAQRAALRRRHHAQARDRDCSPSACSAPKPGEWIAVLGGWSEEQFTDEERGFPRAELDAIAPNNPVVLQSVYNHSFLNSAALKAAASTTRPPIRRAATIEKDASGAARPAWCAAPAASPSSPQKFRTPIRRPGSPTRASSWRISIRSASPPGRTSAAAA